MTQPDNLTIDPAIGTDTRRLADIISRSFADVARRFDLTPQNCPKHPSNCTRQWIERDQARDVSYFILRANDVDAGCVGVEKASETTCYMERLAVLPDQRNNGYGTRLARYALHRAGELGTSRMGIGIIAADTGLKRFYESLGFETGETKTFAHLPFEVAFMSISLKKGST